MSPPERRHLLSVLDLSRDELEQVLHDAEGFEEIAARPIKKVPTLRGRTVVNLFYENSTRTRVSFEIAAKRLSADVVNVSSSASSVAKGESLRDTADTLLAMGADAIVLRHPSAGAPHLLARTVDASVINAGDGAHEHPTQAVLDMYTVRKRLGRVEGLTVAIVGDIAHSRVARSVTLGFRRMGADVVAVGPPTMIPSGVAALGCEVSSDLDAVLPHVDVLYLLRLQRERHLEALIPSEREFVRLYGVDARRLDLLPDHALLMHPVPMNRGVEISWDAAESARSVVTEQVTAGVAVRMALLYHLLGAPASVEAAS